jgi:large subunit ribosomal protein L10e
MAKLRKFSAYRRTERPYTRISKFKKKSFIKANPHIAIVRFEMGEPRKKFEYTYRLIAKSTLQIRHNALESARQSSNRLLEKTLGTANYFFKIRIYPYHILRENPLASGAGADRFSTGMAHPFGKPIGKAAQVKRGQILATLSVDKNHLETAKTAMKRVAYKLPCACLIELSKNA